MGSTLARALHQQGYSVKSLFNRTPKRADDLGQELNVEITGKFPTSTEQLGSIIFISVSDGAIATVAEKLGEEGWDLSGRLIAHCSGNEISDILQPLGKQAAVVAAFHPLQTFNLQSRPSIFRDIYISLEGEEPALSELEQVATDLGSNPLPISAEAKPYLHAAAVMASNYLITLMQIAGEIAELGGINHEQARKALGPLVQTTAHNMTSKKLSQVLSGPIARGDLNTVKKHLHLLEHNSRLKSLYIRLGKETERLAVQKDTLDERTGRQLRNLLEEWDNSGESET